MPPSDVPEAVANHGANTVSMFTVGTGGSPGLANGMFRNRLSSVRTLGSGVRRPAGAGLHSLWTAAANHIPTITVCFVNDEYLLLKELWVNFVGGSLESTRFVGLDFRDPPIDVAGIAQGFGARTAHISAMAEIGPVLDDAFGYSGPTFITIDRSRTGAAGQR